MAGHEAGHDVLNHAPKPTDRSPRVLRLAGPSDNVPGPVHIETRRRNGGAPVSRCLQAVILSTGIAAAILGLPGNSSAGVLGPAPPPPTATSANSATSSSWLAGAHAGYNWQNGSAVYGFETDLSATHLDSSMQGTLAFPFQVIPPPLTSTTATIDWYGTLRGRLGVTAGPVLFYGTAGLAYGNVGLNGNVSSFGSSLNSQMSTVRTGWVAGAGIEYMWRPNLIFSFGYQYVDLGTLSLASSMTIPVTMSQSASTHAQFQAVMAGFSWRFTPTASSGPWQGGYVGGQAGGAWGLPTDANYSATAPAPPPPPPISDVRLKRDITLLGRRDDGLGIYRFKYLWSDTAYVGVLAQEVALVHPDAVVRDLLSGYLSVDYGRLGLHMVALSE
jgi:outer membrane immunogenic protein